MRPARSRQTTPEFRRESQFLMSYADGERRRAGKAAVQGGEPHLAELSGTRTLGVRGMVRLGVTGSTTAFGAVRSRFESWGRSATDRRSVRRARARIVCQWRGAKKAMIRLFHCSAVAERDRSQIGQACPGHESSAGGEVPKRRRFAFFTALLSRSATDRRSVRRASAQIACHAKSFG